MSNLWKYKPLRTLDTTPSGRLLYLIICDLAETDGSITVSQRQIAKTTGLSQTTVRKNLIRLSDAGYLSVIPQYHADGGRAANKYVIK